MVFLLAKHYFQVLETVPFGNAILTEFLRAQAFYYYSVYETSNDFSIQQTVKFYKWDAQLECDLTSALGSSSDSFNPSDMKKI